MPPSPRLRPALLVAALAIAACSAGPATPAPDRTPSPAASAPDPPAGGTPSPMASSVAPTPNGSRSSPPRVAAERLLAADRFEVELSVRRERRPGDPVETLVVGAGVVEPALGRARMRYDLGGLLTIPGASSPPDPDPDPDPDAVVDVVWTPDRLFLRFPGRADREWVGRPRADARRNGGLIGRLPDEVLGLVSLVASGHPDRTLRGDDASLDEAPASHWLVRVPLEQAVGAGVPADAPDVAVLREAYGIDEVEVEAWLVDDAIRRLRYAFSRDQAPYGGPDRTIVTYDWRPAPDAEPVEPPASAGSESG